MDDLFVWGKQKFVDGYVPGNQTLVDPNRQKNARDIFAESVFEEMAERRSYSEQRADEKEEDLLEEEEGELNVDEMEKLAKDYLMKTYGVDEMPQMHKEVEEVEATQDAEPEAAVPEAAET